MKDLERYKVAMLPIPERIENALRKGVESGDFPGFLCASRVFSDWGRYSNRVVRAESGLVMVACTTDMPGVTPQMIDWWFGWHLPESQRYRLWHPSAHVRARVRDDRSQGLADREKYIGNVSSVDERIGRKRMRLDIAFLDPREIGLDLADEPGATAICARTSDRVFKGDSGHLIHLVRKTDTGSEMRSVFWLGELDLKWPIIGRLIRPALNAPSVRRFFVSNQVALDLLRHCAEEMNHLPRFLPALYAEMCGVSANHSPQARDP